MKRTSAWNKASEELKRYQELYEKYKDKPEFINSQYGDPFDGEKVSQLTTSFGQDSESEVSQRKRQSLDQTTVTETVPLKYPGADTWRRQWHCFFLISAGRAQ